MITIQREPVSAVSSDINFPMKGRRGMKDWARTAEDKLYIPKEVFTNPTEGRRTKIDILCHPLGFFKLWAFWYQHVPLCLFHSHPMYCTWNTRSIIFVSFFKRNYQLDLTLMLILQTEVCLKSDLSTKLVTMVWIGCSCYPHSQSWILDLGGPVITPLNPLPTQGQTKKLSECEFTLRDVSHGST